MYCRFNKRVFLVYSGHCSCQVVNWKLSLWIRKSLLLCNHNTPKESIASSCHNVATEPALQSLQQAWDFSTDNACFDICSTRFWNNAFFNVGFFHYNASNNHSMSLAGAYKKPGVIKEREYRHATSSWCATWYVYMLGWHDFSETTKTYFPVVSWMRCCLSFVTLHSTIVLYFHHHPVRDVEIAHTILCLLTPCTLHHVLPLLFLALYIYNVTKKSASRSCQPDTICDAQSCWHQSAMHTIV